MKKLETNQQQATTSISEANQLAAYYQAQLLFLFNSVCAPATSTITTTTTTSAGGSGNCMDGSAISDYYRQLFGYVWNDRTPTSSDAEDTGTPLVSDVEQEGDKDRRQNEGVLDPFVGEMGTTSDKPRPPRPVVRKASEVKKVGEKRKEKQHRNHKHLAWSPKKIQSSAANKQNLANESQLANNRTDQGTRLNSTNERPGKRAKDSRSPVTSSRNQMDDNRVDEAESPTLTGNKSGMTNDESVKDMCSAETGKLARERTHSVMTRESQRANERPLGGEWKEEQHRDLSVVPCKATRVPDRDSCSQDISPVGRKMSRHPSEDGNRANKSPSRDGKGKSSCAQEKRATPKEEKGNHLSPKRRVKMPEKHREEKGARELQKGRGKLSCANSESSSTSSSGVNVIHVCTRSRSPSYDKENRRRPPLLNENRGRRQTEDLKSLRGSINNQSRGGESSKKRTSLSNSSCMDIKDRRSSQSTSNVEDKRSGQRDVENKLLGRSKSLQRDVKEDSKRRRLSRKRKHSCTPPQTGSQLEDVKHARTGSDVTEPSSSSRYPSPSHESSLPVSFGSVTSPVSLTPNFDDITAPPTPNANEILPYCAEVQVCENSVLVMYESGCGQQSLLDMSCPPTPTSELLNEEEIENDQNVAQPNDGDSQSTEAKKVHLETSVSITGGSCRNVAGADDLAENCKTELGIEPQNETGADCNDVVTTQDTQDTQLMHQTNDRDDKSEQSTKREERLSQNASTSNCMEEIQSQGNTCKQTLCEESESVEDDNDLEEGEISGSDEDSEENQTVKKQTTIITFTIPPARDKETRGHQNMKTSESCPYNREAIKRPIHERISVTKRSHHRRVTPPRSHRRDGALGSMRQHLRGPLVASSRSSRHLPLSERRGNRYSPPSPKKRSSENLHHDNHMIRKHPHGDRHSYHHSSKHQRPSLPEF